MGFDLTLKALTNKLDLTLTQFDLTLKSDLTNKGFDLTNNFPIYDPY